MNRFNILMLLVLALEGTIACSKSSNNTPGITGKWAIINDSTRFIGTDTIPTYHSNYIGQPSDYFDFRTDGNMYVKEAALLDTMPYEVLANNQVRCTPAPGFNDTYTTSQITPTTATFSIIATRPSGKLTKIINLKK